ncbi:MAG: hypothetical protein ABR929_04870 [Roseiarcus sp.]|jgi:chromosome segregation ATPase
MASEPSDKELELAARVNELDDDALRPAVAGSGLLAAAVNFLLGRVTKGIVTAVLTVFIAYHAWEAFNASQQLTADLQIKTAEAGKMIAEAKAITAKTGETTLRFAALQAELDKTQQQAIAAKADADAQNAIVDGASVRLRTLQAELDKTQQQAAAAKADADAQNQIIDGAPMRLVTLRAELEKTRAEAQQAKADADAQTQKIDGMTVAVAQEQADVAALEGEARKEVAQVRLLMSVAVDPGGVAGRAMDATAPGIWGNR